MTAKKYKSKTPIDILNDALTEVDAVMKKYDLIGLVNLADKHGNGAGGEKIDASWTPFILDDGKSYAIQKDWETKEETEDICILHKAIMRLYSLDFRNGRTIRRVMNVLLTHSLMPNKIERHNPNENNLQKETTTV